MNICKVRSTFAGITVELLMGLNRLTQRNNVLSGFCPYNSGDQVKWNKMCGTSGTHEEENKFIEKFLQSFVAETLRKNRVGC